MTRVLLLFFVISIIAIIEIKAKNNSTESVEQSVTSKNSNSSENDSSRQITKRHLRTVNFKGFDGRSNSFNRNRPRRNKRTRKPKPRRPQNSVQYEVSPSSDFDDSDFKKQLQDERRTRYNKQKQRLENFEDYFNRPDLGHVFNGDEIKDLFLTTDYDYGKFIRDYNNKLRENRYPKKHKNQFEFEEEYGPDEFKDSEGIYDFSETSNPATPEKESNYYKFLSKYKKNDATQQISPVLKYELENVKDFGVRQNSYGEYPKVNQASEFGNSGMYDYTLSPDDTDRDSFDYKYPMELLKTANKTKSKPKQTKSSFYVNHAPSYTTVDPKGFNYNPTLFDDNKETTIFDNSNKYYKSSNFANTNIPSVTRNYANEYNFDSVPTKGVSVTKYSLNEWNDNVKNGGKQLSDFDSKRNNQFTTIDAIIEGGIKNFDQNKELNIDILKQFYDLNNYNTPSYTNGVVTITPRPMTSDQYNDGTMNYEQQAMGTSWKNNGGWQIMDPNKLPGTQMPVDVTKPIIVPVPHPYPVKVPITKPVAVPVITEIKIPIEKEVPYAVVKNVPYPVEKPVPVKVEKEVTVTVSKPYPVKIPIIKNVYHHAHDSRYHNDEWESEQGPDRNQHETWDEYYSPADYAPFEEEPVSKKPQKTVWRNGRPKKRNNNHQSQTADDTESDYSNYRPKKRHPSGPGRTSGKNRNTRTKNNKNRPRLGGRTNKITITRRLNDD